MYRCGNKPAAEVSQFEIIRVIFVHGFASESGFSTRVVKLYGRTRSPSCQTGALWHMKQSGA
jgi:hypothetical protein